MSVSVLSNREASQPLSTAARPTKKKKKKKRKKKVSANVSFIYFTDAVFMALVLLFIIYRFYIALLSALQQAHCAYVACDSE